jgi:hypothetical protein
LSKKTNDLGCDEMSMRRKPLSPNDFFAYAVSSERMNVVRRFAREQDLPLRRRYCETVLDARTELFRRPRLIGVIADLRANSINHLVIDSWDKLSLNGAKCNGLRQYLHTLSVEVTTATPESAPQKVCRRVDQRQATQELALLKQAVTRRVNHSKLGRLSISQQVGEEAAVARILELARLLPRDQWKKRAGETIKRRSPGEIARRLTSEDIVRTHGNPWTDDAVRKVLNKMRPLWI